MLLTTTQQEAAHTADKSTAVVAGAGSGKTLVLTEHYRHLIDKGVPTYKILTFTFTEKAAAEIKERILKEGILRPEETALTHIGTAHSFLSRILRRFGPILNLDPAFTITSETEAIIDKHNQARRFLLDKINSKNPFILKLIDRFGFARLSKIFRDLAGEPRLFRRTPPSPQLQTDENNLLTSVHEFFEAWMKEKIRNRALHFDDLEFLAVRLLENNPEIRKRLSRQYEHILVDEFQDTNPFQGTLIDLLFEPGTNHLFIVGDPKQSIYRFRKADVSLFRRAAGKIQQSGGKINQLDETFRLPPVLTDIINKVFQPLFAEDGDNSFFRPMKSSSQNDGALHIIEATREKITIDKLRKLEARWIASRLIEMNLSPAERDQTAILFRSSAPMIIYRNELLKAEIPCQVTRTDMLLETPEIRDLLHILTYLAGDTRPTTQVGILRSPFFSMSEIFIEHFIHSQPPHLLAPYIPDLFSSPEDKEKWDRVIALFSRWERLKKILSPSILVRTIISDLELLSSEKLHPDEQIRLNIEQFLHLTEELEEENLLSLETLDQMLTHAREADKDIKTLELKTECGALHLMTIHAAKGLEFKRLFLPQLYAQIRGHSTDYYYDPQDGLAFKEEDKEKISGLSIKLKEPPLFTSMKKLEEKEKREEAKRLLYVAMTRASEELFLFLKEPAKKRINILESNSWNEWLWTLLAEERKNAISLSEEKRTQFSPGQATGHWSRVTGHESLVTSHPPPPRLRRTSESSSFAKASADKRATSDERRLPAEAVVAGTTSDGRRAVAHSVPCTLYPVPSLPKPTYTVSEIETYLRCEKEYELKHIYGIEAVSGTHFKTPPPEAERRVAEGGGFETGSSHESRVTSHESSSFAKASADKRVILLRQGFGGQASDERRLPAEAVVAGTTGDGQRATHTPLSPQQRGILIHEVMQFIDLTNLSNQQTVIEQALINQQIEDPDHQIRNKISELISNLSSNREISSLLTNHNAVHNELPFILDCGDFYLRGKLDRLQENNGQWIVIDYKTDRIGRDELDQREKAYSGQMAAYALAAGNILGAEQIKTALIFTSGPYLRTKEWDNENINRARQTLINVNQTLSQKNYPTFQYPENRDICRHCPYFELNYCGIRQ